MVTEYKLYLTTFFSSPELGVLFSGKILLTLSVVLSTGTSSGLLTMVFVVDFQLFSLPIGFVASIECFLQPGKITRRKCRWHLY